MRKGRICMEGTHMRKWFFILTLSVAIPAVAVAEEPVHIPDAAFKAVVEDALWVTDPTPTDMLSLTSLHANSRGIRDITGLEYAANLQTLVLRWNQISDISALAGLTHLTYLDAHDNYIADISALAALTHLETLVLRYNRIRDLSALADHTSLAALDLRANPLSSAACDVYIPLIRANNPGIGLEYDPCVTRRLVLLSTAGGSVVSPGEGEFTYENGASVDLEAQADPGFFFVRWSGTCFTAENPASVSMDQDHRIVANFASLADPNTILEPENPGDVTGGAGDPGTLYVDDDARDDPGPGDTASSDPRENGTTEHPFDSIQEAIVAATTEMVRIIVRPGAYRESIDLLGRRIQLTGIDPAASGPRPYPVLDGNDTGPIVQFASGEGPDCTLQGFVITRGRGDPAAILCSGASPTISNCLIVGNRSGVPQGAAVTCTNSRAVFANCTICNNYGHEHGAAVHVKDGRVLMTDSIIRDNGFASILVGGDGAISVNFSDVAGGWPGLGNIDAEPLFAAAGRWSDRNDPNIPRSPQDVQAVWIEGDYHLRSQAGRWEPGTRSWVRDDATSPCIDAGNPNSPVNREPAPNGSVINMGAYGGTDQASKQHLAEP